MEFFCYGEGVEGKNTFAWHDCGESTCWSCCLRSVLLLHEGEVNRWHLRTVKLLRMLLPGQMLVPSGQLCAAVK